MFNRYCGEYFSTRSDATASCAIIGMYLGQFTFLINSFYFSESNALHTVERNLYFLDCTGPFEVGFRTDATRDANADGTDVSRGVCLEYVQLPCGSVCGNP